MNFNAAPGLAEQIADHLGQLIIRGEIKPGERIQEVKVTKALNVSRGSVREALLILERRYLINNIPRKGALVTKLSQADINGLYELLGCLYSLLGQHLAGAWQTEKDLEPFDKLIMQMEQAVENNDSIALFELSFGFSDVARNLVQNVFLSETLQNLRPAFSRIYFKILNQHPEELAYIVDFLKASMSHVRARAVEKNRQLVKEYFEHQCEVALKVHHEDVIKAAIA